MASCVFFFLEMTGLQRKILGDSSDLLRIRLSRKCSCNISKCLLFWRPRRFLCKQTVFSPFSLVAFWRCFSAFSTKEIILFLAKGLCLSQQAIILPLEKLYQSDTTQSKRVINCVCSLSKKVKEF